MNKFPSKKLTTLTLFLPTVFMAGITTLATAPAWAQAPAATSEKSQADLERLHQTTLGIVEALVTRGILTRENADALLSSASQKAQQAVASREAAAAAAPKTPEPVRVQYVPEAVKREMREEIRKEVLAQAKNEKWGNPDTVPEWINRITVTGDVRARYQTDRFNATNGQPSQYFDNEDITNFAGLTNTLNDVNRFRIRARLGINANIADTVSANLRLSTGSTTGPISSSATSGDASNRYGIKIDRAGLRITPLDWLTIDAGRINNPFFSTEIQHASDLGFDGVALAFKPNVNPSIKPFATIGAFPIRHNAATGDRVMRAVQLGTQWQVNPKSGLRIAVAQFKYANAAGTPLGDRFDPTYNTSEYESGFRQRGNTLFRINQDQFVTVNPVYGLASNFNVQAITASVELAQFDPFLLTLTAETIVNKGFDPAAVAARTGFDGIEKRNRGSYLQLTAGHRSISQPGQWQFGVSLRKVERDATLDAFTDPDFVAGGTNVRGQTLSFTYGVAKNTSLGFKLLSGKSIDPPLSDPLAEPFKLKSIQLDLNTRF